MERVSPALELALGNVIGLVFDACQNKKQTKNHNKKAVLYDRAIRAI